MTEADAAQLDTFTALRSRLFGIAYRMIGSAADADDVVQDAWLRWQHVDPPTVDNAEAYLVSTVTRLAIDRLRSAQHRREEYVGPYLPEPIVATGADPADASELADSLTFAFLVLLDDLSATERAVFLLHDVFSYSFDEVAAATGKTSAACRQIASRTRKRIGEHRDDARRVRDQHEQAMVDQFLTTTGTGDIAGLMALLAPDVVSLDDGGRLRRAARYPVVGPDRVARLFVNLTKRMLTMPEYTVEVADVNTQRGIVVRRNGKVDIVMTFAYGPDGRIRRVYAQLNPDKLRWFDATLP